MKAVQRVPRKKDEVSIRGEVRTWAQWLAASRMSPITIGTRVREGWPLDEALAADKKMSHRRQKTAARPTQPFTATKGQQETMDRALEAFKVDPGYVILMAQEAQALRQQQEEWRQAMEVAWADLMRVEGNITDARSALVRMHDQAGQ